LSGEAEAAAREDELEPVEDERLEEEERVHELPLEEEPLLEESQPDDEAAAEPENEVEEQPEEAEEEPVGTPITQLRAAEHAEGELDIPDEVVLLEGVADGKRRSVAIVAARFNGEITNRLLQSALEELEDAGVRLDAITIMPVPGAFELPLAAMALAKTRRYACVVALGCVIRGETPHFEYIASEAASGLQLAALETGVPVAFGVLTVDNLGQAEARAGKGAEAARTALEMADAFAQLRASAAAAP
jgi:6,7-dimethyl-8-ribityllumazine synthase